MTNNNHPITPPPELVREWQIKIEYCSKRADREATVAKIFQLGADQELEACCEWLRNAMNHGLDYDIGQSLAVKLLTARRPKPISLQDQALDDLERIAALLMRYSLPCDTGNIRRALESLPD